MEKRKNSLTWAGNAIALIFAFFIGIQYSSAQQNLRLIKAKSKDVIIRDGHVILSGTWALSPAVKPDVYNVLTPFTEKIITFYTDIDSISFQVKPGEAYDFAVLLNGKDTCYTRIAMGIDKSASELGMPLISREQLAMDFMVFRDYLEREHAGLYRYQTKSKIDQLFDTGIKEIKGPANRLDFGKNIMSIISAIQDGHTGTNLSSTILNAYRDSVKLFPLFLYFDDKSAFVRCSQLRAFPIGTEIISINDIKMAEIKEKLFSYLPGDGKIQSKKRNTLNNGSFAFLYRLVFGHTSSFLVKYREPNGVLKIANINAALSKDFDCDIPNPQQKGKDLQLNFLSKDIAQLTIKTFDQGRLNRNKLDFPKFLEESFLEIKTKKYQKLIVDLRGNGGGLDKYGPMLYAYLARKPFNYFAAVYSANSKQPIPNNPFVGIQQPIPNNFSGEIVFLIDGLSFSCTADFCAIAKSNNRGKFVGEETAGAYYGNNSGQTIRLELPSSKIQVIIPKFRYINDVKKTRYVDRGVIPDYKVIPNINEILANKDVQLAYAVRLLQ